MKRSVSFVLFLSCCLGILTGCSTHALQDASFYYCRDAGEYQYFQQDGVITAEGRDLSGHTNDLRYLISLYLAGPLEEGLVCPFPRSTRLVQAGITSGIIEIELSDSDDSITDSAFSLAAACLSKTCLEHFGGTSVTIRSGTRTITINEKNIILFDSAMPDTTEGG